MFERRTLEDVQIPDPIRAAVTRRLHQLDRSERAIVMRASVIGSEFDLTVLVASGKSSESRVLAALDHALALQLIVTSETDGRHHFAFRHAVTRDIIYAELVTDRTRKLHRRVGAAIERTASDSDAHLPNIAYHYWLSGDANRSLRFNERAGDNAAAIHAFDDARLSYTRARSLIEVHTLDYDRITRKLNALPSDRSDITR